MKKIRFCKICKKYTLLEIHCDQMSVSAHPPKYNPNDRFAEIRRKINYPDAF
ncbi:ribosome biogenesis protein [Candidatus Micrarchaeota archaeon]|nr:ribosome biogenesis protein [Candidatus Micrarchaeota archaeon]